jgi:phenylpropionate dioxygenase-like ring-hydroxylating dioxygenase large terminal subunit
METVIDRDGYGLHRAPVREVGGLVFVWLDGASEPAPFENAGRDLAGALHPQGLARAKVAAQIDYDVAANWKLVWQNNRECWHAADAGRRPPHGDPSAVAGRPRAQAGVDYGLDRLLPFWQLTSEQDWELCERNQMGVENPAYTPGPYSPERERNVIAFDAWYLRRMALS